VAAVPSDQVADHEKPIPPLGSPPTKGLVASMVTSPEQSHKALMDVPFSPVKKISKLSTDGNPATSKVAPTGVTSLLPSPYVIVADTV
jgi:hypothetical protein